MRVTDQDERAVSLSYRVNVQLNTSSTDRDLIFDFVEGALFDAFYVHYVFGIFVRAALDDRLGFHWANAGEAFKFGFGGMV